MSKKHTGSIVLACAWKAARSTFTMIIAAAALIIGLLCISFLYWQSSSLIAHSGYASGLLLRGGEDSLRAAGDYARAQDLLIIVEDARGKLLYASSELPGEGKAVKLPGWFSLYGDGAQETPAPLSIEIGNGLVTSALLDSVPPVTLRLEIKLERYYWILWRLCFWTLIAAAAFSVLAGFSTGLCLRRMLAPMREMTGRVRSITIDSLDTRLELEGSREIMELADTFNKMLDSLQFSYEMQDRFVSDASHELRTPIAVIQGYANLLRRWGTQDPEILNESIEALANEASNMKDLVDKLLFLARADSDKQKTEKEDFPLDELIDEAVRETRMIDKNHSIEFGQKASLIVAGDRAALKQALRILIDNSVKYTPEGGKITIEGFEQGGYAVVTVKDTGIGISPEDQAHIFDRFFKSDASRRGGGGAGLGLSIAKWIVERHGGTIEVYSMLGYGTKMYISIPMRGA